MEAKSEVERIKEVYKRRKDNVPSYRYSFFNPANLFIVQQRDGEIIDAFKRYGIFSLEEKRILDVGCGDGKELRNLMRYGAAPENLFGVDLLPDRIMTAGKIAPNISFLCGSAETLPYESGFFDIVMQFTVFTSILDKEMKKKVASEMFRVLKQDGMILWYDYHMNNPRNPDVRGIGKKEIYELFPTCGISLERITLAPPLARIVAPLSIICCQLLEKVPLLCTHYLGVIRKLSDHKKSPHGDKRTASHNEAFL